MYCVLKLKFFIRYSSWSYSFSGQNIYLRTYDNVAQVNTQGHGNDCSYHGVSTLTVTMSEELDDATFMCSILEAEHSDTDQPTNSDKVKLELKGMPDFLCIVFYSLLLLLLLLLLTMIPINDNGIQFSATRLHIPQAKEIASHSGTV